MMSEIWTIGSILQWTTRHFEKYGIPEPRLEAEVLLAAALNCPRLTLHVRQDEELSKDTLQQFKSYVIERQKRRPVAYILGEKEFMGLRFFVDEHTLIPRPETELLVEAAQRRIEAGQDNTVVDLCTGSGCIAVSLAKLSPARKVYACDISLDALKVAQANIDQHGVGRKVFIKYGDLLAALEGEVQQGAVDMVVSNPPYVAESELAFLEPELGFEPRLALDGGKDGLDYYRRIAAESRPYIRTGGCLLLEMSAAKSVQIREIVENAGWTVEEVIKDYSGLDRVMVVKN